MLHASRVQKVGSYTLGERLGVGGMAEVYEARSADGQTVALKRILPSLARDREFCEMFADEARVTGRLEHPNVVRVLELGNSNGELFMALEYVDGPSLAKVLRRAARERSAADVSAIVSVGAQLLAALDFVHNATDDHGRLLSIVHRDVSPGNVMLSSSGDLKLGDFGIVRSEIVARRTQPGELKGKIGYMSPEQASGFSVDPRSDLFSVGIILAELLTLRPLFLGKNEMDTLGRTAHADLSTWHRFNSHVPLALRGVVEKALSKVAGERYSSAREMRHAWLESARIARIPEEEGALKKWLVQLGLVQVGERPDRSGERVIAVGRSDSSSSSSTSSPSYGSSSSESGARTIAESGRTSPLGLPTMRRGRPVWTLDVSPRSLPTQLLLALRRVHTGGVELSEEGRSIYLEVRHGRIMAAHDTTGSHALGRLLLEESILERSDVIRAIGESRRVGLRLGEYLVGQRKIRESVLIRLLKEQIERRLGTAFEYQSAKLSVLSLEDVVDASRPLAERATVRPPRSRSLPPDAELPESFNQVVTALRRSFLHGGLELHLAPVLDAVVLPAVASTDPTALGLTGPEVRAISTALEGGALEGRSVRAIIETVVEERLARRKEVEFALFVALCAGLVHAPGFGAR